MKDALSAHLAKGCSDKAMRLAKLLFLSSARAPLIPSNPHSSHHLSTYPVSHLRLRDLHSLQQIWFNSTIVIVLPSLDMSTQPSLSPSFPHVLGVKRRWIVPKDKDEPDCLQKQYIFKETKCYSFSYRSAMFHTPSLLLTEVTSATCLWICV